MEDKNIIFTDKLKKFSKLFEDDFDKQKAQEMKVEINTIDKTDAINMWVELLNENCPVEKTDKNTYEIHDIINFKGEGNSEDYIHIVNLSDNDDTSSVFMKFYFIFYCIGNKLKSNSYFMKKK